MLSFRRVFIFMSLVVLVSFEALAGPAADAYQFVGFGDTPYGEQGEKDFPKLIQNINKTDVDFAVHIGDIKNGRSLCTDEHFTKVYNEFETFKTALIYTPGDNEWTDCHRKSNGSFDPIERLQMLRKIFFKNPTQSLGQKPIALQSQINDKAHSLYRENAVWESHNMVFVTIHMIGSYNNVDRNPSATQEFLKRNAANIDWIQNAFALAKKHNAKSVVVFTQANPWMLASTGDYVVVGGFNEFMTEFNKLTTEFKNPVLFVHGDTHIYRHDKKTVSKDFQALKNFYRLEVPGDEDTGAVLITADFAKTEPFAFKKIAP